MNEGIARRRVLWFIALALVVAACGDSDGASFQAATCEVGSTDGDLAISIRSDYIDEQQLDAFASEFGIEVTMAAYESDEAMRTTIAASNSGFDLVIPSDYMVALLIDAGSVQALNKEALPNLANISSEFQSLPYDIDGDFSVPYQWGTTGLAVDTAVVGRDFPRSWSIIFDPATADRHEGRISLLDHPRETLGAALKYLGYSLNSTRESELAEAEELVASTKNRLAGFYTDSAGDRLTAGGTAIAHGYSGRMFAQFLDTGKPAQYVYFVPDEGGTRWIDTMAIPFDAPSPCSAHTFINWLLTPGEGAVLSNWNRDATPNSAAMDLLDEELLDFLNDPSVITGGLGSLEIIQDTGEFETNYTDAFEQAKG